jgi:hypothetical protein
MDPEGRSSRHYLAGICECLDRLPVVTLIRLAVIPQDTTWQSFLDERSSGSPASPSVSKRIIERALVQCSTV